MTGWAQVPDEAKADTAPATSVPAARPVDGGAKEAVKETTVKGADAKFTPTFDGVFSSEGIEIVNTPVRAPKANAVAERFVATARRECLDWLLILNRRHLEHMLGVFVDHYNAHRPHRSLNLAPPAATGLERRIASSSGDLMRRDRLGGLIHEYHYAA